MAEPIPEPLDLDEVFAPYKPENKKLKKQEEDTTVAGVVRNAFKEGKASYVLAPAAVGTAAVGASKYWNKKVMQNMELIKQAAAEERAAVETARSAGYAARGATLNKPLVTAMTGASTEGTALPTTVRGQYQLAKDITRSKLLKPLGVGKYAESALTPKVSLTPQYQTPRYIFDENGLITGYAPETRTAFPSVVSAKKIPELVSTGNTTGSNLVETANAGAEVATLPLNRYQSAFAGTRGFVNNAMYGNARIPINSVGTASKALLKSGVGIGAIMEGGTALYDTWPTWLGGSGNNIYGRTAEEFRRGLSEKDNPFLYNYGAAAAGTLANFKRYGEAAGNALTLGGYGLVTGVLDMNKMIKQKEAEMQSQFEENPEKFRPDVLEKQRQRQLASGLIDPSTWRGSMSEDTPEAWDEYNKKLAELKKKKSEKK